MTREEAFFAADILSQLVPHGFNPVWVQVVEGTDEYRVVTNVWDNSAGTYVENIITDAASAVHVFRDLNYQ